MLETVRNSIEEPTEFYIAAERERRVINLKELYGLIRSYFNILYKYILKRENWRKAVVADS